jgi:hypothetical protein
MRKTFEINTKDDNGKFKTLTSRTIVPDPVPNPGTSHAYRTFKAEFQARFLSGRNTGSSVGSDQKFETALNHFSEYLDVAEHIHSGDSLDKGHVDRFVDRLADGTSILTGKKLADKTVKDILGNVRKILITIKKDYFLKGTYADMGLKVGHKDLERPIQFTDDYLIRRDAYQEALESHRTTWYAEAARIGRAFGMREAERIESRDTIKVVDGKLYATHLLGPHKEVSAKQLKARYGKTIMRRAEKLVEGKEYLIVEHAKGNRNRFVEIPDGRRREAVERLHGFIRSQDGHSNNRRCYPDKTTCQQAERNYTRTQERYGATRESQLHAHGDRHHEAQSKYAELKSSGMSEKDAKLAVIEMLGHSDPRKCNYYFR